MSGLRRHRAVYGRGPAVLYSAVRRRASLRQTYRAPENAPPVSLALPEPCCQLDLAYYTARPLASNPEQVFPRA